MATILRRSNHLKLTHAELRNGAILVEEMFTVTHPTRSAERFGLGRRRRHVLKACCPRWDNAVPTVLRLHGFRYHFYSHEPNEPPHVHVDKGECSTKVWLDPVAVARNHGYRPTELRVILGAVRDHRVMMLEAWHGYFG